MKPIDFFPRFNTLSNKSLSVDFHLHSTWTDGKNSIQEIIDFSNKKTLTRLQLQIIFEKNLHILIITKRRLDSSMRLIKLIYMSGLRRKFLIFLAI